MTRRSTGLDNYSSLVGPSLPVWVMIAAGLALLTLASFTAHAELAARRPQTHLLTAFYIVVAAGGALGGVLNGVLAPLAFTWVWEYPLAIVLAVLVTVKGAPVPWALLTRYHSLFARGLEWLLVLLLSLGAFSLIAIDPLREGWGVVLLITTWAGLGALVSGRSAPVAAALVGLLLLPVIMEDGNVMVRDRSFYGAYTVRESDGERVLSHGTTVHGRQWVGQAAAEPSTYYARSGPVGDTFEVLPAVADVAVVGLGVGTIAAYGEDGQSFTFFEIDPEIVDVAKDTSLFTYVADSRAETQFVLGDGRVQLEEVPSGSYDVLFLDAFTSDAIPIHLLTLEAFTTYERVLSDGGTLLVHVSNRVFNLEPVVASAADDLGWSVAVGRGSAEEESGATVSEWIALSADSSVIGDLLEKENWRLPEARRVRWTDDFSSVLTVIR